MSVCVYVGPTSRKARPRKTKIGTDVAHITRNSDTTFKVKSKVNLQTAGAYCGGLPHSFLFSSWSWSYEFGLIDITDGNQDEKKNMNK